MIVLSLDGSASGSQVTDTNTVSATLSTTNAGDVIVAFVYQTYYYPTTGSVTNTVTSITDTAGLTFSERGSVAISTKHAQVDEWYAVSPGQLSSDVVTAHVAGPSDELIQVFGINGVNTASPYDPNSGLPATNSISSTGVDVFESTSDAADFLIGGLAADLNSGQTISGTPAGFTNIINTGPQCDSGANCIAGESAYEVVSATQANLLLAWTVSVSHSMAAIGDASDG